MSLHQVSLVAKGLGIDMLERRDEWVYRFTNAELSELDNAMWITFQSEIADIKREHFALPMIGPVFDDMRREILKGRGFVLLRGITTLGNVSAR